MGQIQCEEDQIVEQLKKRVDVWFFPRLLEEMCGSLSSVQKKLTEKLTEYEANGGNSREQTARKVRNWMKGKNQPSNREELFRICFALNFDQEQSERIFLASEESGIHYRNPRELIYVFCLKKGYDYPKAREIIKELGQAETPCSTLEYQDMIRRTRGRDSSDCMTVSIKNEFRQVETVEELKSFIGRNREAFGLHHNTAYHKFRLMLNYLLEGETAHDSYEYVPREKRYSIERVTEEYLRLGIPYQKKNGNYTKVQRMIKRHWPSPKMVQEMYSRRRDVNRKTLLLLYLATEGMGADAAEKSFVQEHCRRMNMMMSSCGMPLLDLRHPFDYLVIQSLYLENDDDFMSWKMERLLRKIFRKEYKPAYIAIKTAES